MRNATLAFESFMQGFTRAGLFSWAAMPGGAVRIFEETTDLEQSEFAELLLPIAQLETPAPREVVDEGVIDAEYVDVSDSADRDRTPLMVVIQNADGSFGIAKKIPAGGIGDTQDLLLRGTGKVFKSLKEALEAHER